MKGKYTIKTEKDYLLKDKLLFRILYCDYCDNEMGRVGLDHDGQAGTETYICDSCWIGKE